MQYSDYKCFRFLFDSGVAFVSIDHPPINLLDEVLSQEFDKLGRESLRLFKSDRWWHREFLTCNEDFDHRRTVVSQSLRNHRFYLVRRSRSQPQKSGSFGDFCEIRTLKIGCKI